MDASPLSGYITRKEAAHRCQRAERTLQRYWSRAIELKNVAVLSHLKLWTEDGRTIAGPGVTKEQIEDLKAAGQNPTWFAEEQWVMNTYGPRSAASRPDRRADEDEGAPGAEEGSVVAADAALVVALKNENAELRRDKERLYTELSIKNEQIMEANTRMQESNTLMLQIQNMLSSWHEQALRSLPARTQTVYGASEERTPATEEGSHPLQESRSRRSRQVTRTKKHSSPLGSGRPKWYHMPTFKRFLSHL